MDKIKRCAASVFINDDEIEVSFTKAPNSALFVWLATMMLLFSQYLDSKSKVGYLDAAVVCGVGFTFSILGFMCFYYFIFHSRKTGIIFLMEAIATVACFAWASELSLEPSARGRLLNITLIAYTLSLVFSFIIDRLTRFISSFFVHEKPEQNNKPEQDDESEQNDENEQEEELNEEGPASEYEEKSDPDKEDKDSDDPEKDKDVSESTAEVSSEASDAPKEEISEKSSENPDEDAVKE